MEEGECWEAFMFAAHYGLSNLCVVLDRNHLQIDGTTETVMNSAPLEEKLKAFNFNVVTIDGHDYDQIEAAMQAFHAETAKPTCIIMDTTKGKGVSYMTNSVDWHGKGPNDDEYKIAIEELNARGRYFYKVSEIRRMLEERLIRSNKENIDNLITNHQLYAKERGNLRKNK